MNTLPTHFSQEPKKTSRWEVDKNNKNELFTMCYILIAGDPDPGITFNDKDGKPVALADFRVHADAVYQIFCSPF
ncbi:MAG: hypothetical protein CSA23_07820 [Deltaproteobacteria bacterium]|nr:MAG: hypothetical protein CSA23_07820 [Deltaproteobacteria bacterium]